MLTALNVAFYILSLPLRILIVIIALPVILSSVDWTQSGDYRKVYREAVDLVKYPH